jgi:hypothetical protein
MEEQWDRNDYQGRSKKQVINNHRVLDLLVFVSLSSFSILLIIKIFTKLFF